MTVSLASLTHRYGSDAQDNRVKIHAATMLARKSIPGGNLTPQTEGVLGARRS